MRRAAGAIALAAALVALAACGGRDALTIYSGRGENLVGPLLERFAERTGIPIDVRYGGSGDLALLLAEEGDRTPADVFLSQSPGATGFLAARGLLRELPGDVLEAVDARFRSSSGRWVGLTGRERVLVYNRELIAPADLPRSVLEVTDERYRGRVGVAPQNASFQDFVTAMRLVTGDDATLEWLRDLAASSPRVYPNNNAIVAAVGRGEVAMGLVNHYYNERFLAEDPTLPSRNHVFPDRDIGAVLLVSSVSVTASSDDVERALRFARFMLSAEAQRYFSEETFEYPLAAGVEPPPGLPPLAEIDAPAVDFDRLGGALERTTELIARSGLEG